MLDSHLQIAGLLCTKNAANGTHRERPDIHPYSVNGLRVAIPPNMGHIEIDSSRDVRPLAGNEGEPSVDCYAVSVLDLHTDAHRSLS